MSGSLFQHLRVTRRIQVIDDVEGHAVPNDLLHPIAITIINKPNLAVVPADQVILKVVSIDVTA